MKIDGNLIVEQKFANELPAPFLSLLTEDCIAKAKDYNAGGARYNSSYIQGVGLGSITDSLSAIKHHVYGDGDLTMAQLLDALEANFEDHEDLRQRLRNETPRWGNDDDRADELAVQVFESFYNAVEGRPTWRGGQFRINLLPSTSHVPGHEGRRRRPFHPVLFHGPCNHSVCAGVRRAPRRRARHRVLEPLG